jgi:hypothetical protein
MKLLGIDPGRQGFFVFLYDGRVSDWHVMPTIYGEIQFDHLFESLLQFSRECNGFDHVFLERAVPMAMGSKHAFNYGREFSMLEIAVAALKVPVTYVEPSKWTKEMHAGIDSNYNAKTKSRMAVERLFPDLEAPTKKTGKPHDGFLDALLIAEYGRRQLRGKQNAVA